MANNGTNQQYETVNEDEIEEMIYLPLQIETQKVTEDRRQNHQNDTVIEMKSTGHDTNHHYKTEEIETETEETETEEV